MQNPFATRRYDIPRPAHIALLMGNFKLRDPFSRSHDRVLERMLENASVLIPSASGDGDCLLQAIRMLGDSLEQHKAVTTYGFNLFDIVPPMKFRRGHPGGAAVLAWEVAFQRPSFAADEIPATSETLAEFEKLVEPGDCLKFARRWGRLGPRSDQTYFYLTPENDPETKRKFRDQLAANEIVVKTRRTFLSEEGQRQEDLQATATDNLAVTGEPVDAWLWHAARLRTWRSLLKAISKETQISKRFARLMEFFAQSTDTWMENGIAVQHDPINRVRPTTDADADLIAQNRPWSYALHLEGGEFGFGGAEFGEVRAAINSKPQTKNAKVIQGFVETLLRRSLQGHITVVPKLGRVSDEVIECDSLLVWMYLEFARQHSDALGLTRMVYVRCSVCDEDTPESPHVRGRKKTCSEKCYKKLQRHGLEEARRRNGTLNQVE
jgi:hypothetical protein